MSNRTKLVHWNGMLIMKKIKMTPALKVFPKQGKSECPFCNCQSGFMENDGETHMIEVEEYANVVVFPMWRQIVSG